MSSRTPRPAVRLIRRNIVANLARPVPEVIGHALGCLVDGLDVRAAFLAEMRNESLEVIDAVTRSGSGIAKGTVIPLSDSFPLTADEPLSVRDARSTEPFHRLPMRRMLGIASYLAAPVRFTDGRPFGVVAATGDTPRTFTEEDRDLIMVAAALLGARIEAGRAADQREAGRAPLPQPVMRLATEELGEPLAVLKGYADMLSRGEVPAEHMALVTRRMAHQATNLVRVVEHMLMLARLPLELSFTVRVSLGAVTQAAGDTMRDDLEAMGMELRLQLDTSGEVWGDASLLSAALEEMLHNVLAHAPTATVVQLRLRQSASDRFQLIVKDNGPGISADRLAELFAPFPAGPLPAGLLRRGAGLGLQLVRQVAEAHGGSAWANSVEGKGTTFYMELPAASPDGTAARAAHPLQQTSA